MRRKFEDNPYERVKLTGDDKLVGSKTSIANSRFMALMSISALSNKAVPGASNWIQLGRTAVPEGDTISSYYY